MPLYDFKCPHCHDSVTMLMDFRSYDEFVEGPCEKCGGPLTKVDRDIGRGVVKRVIGVSKGNYNSGDFT